MFHVKQFDIIVVGGGHAGCEAVFAATRMGLKTALVTLDKSKIGEMSCNPSVGGVGKGQLVKEIDALGGLMGQNADYTGIQFKRLNTRKGSAVQSSRCQSDKLRYAKRIRDVLRGVTNLTIIEGEVKALITEGGQIRGVRIYKEEIQTELLSRAVVITAGTFMRGLMYCGSRTSEGGRFGEAPSVGLSDQLRGLGIKLLRLKTGTPPRLKSGSIDFAVMERQQGDTPPRKFSFWNTEIRLPQVPCYLTYTNEKTHRTILSNIDKSPLYSGHIKGVGPRYCPSIEDKVVKFPDKPRHHLFFEPESLDSDWIYPNGISTSMPQEIQEQFVRSIPGCENAEFARYGYAVEYDCIDPTQLERTLELKDVTGLFFAGQINGTSGYEEAAAQGILAGINAALFVQGRLGLELGRERSYLGVMVDDLVSQGVTEPYRMFTSRAEYRLLLREDNADLRLSPIAMDLGLLSDDQKRIYKERARKATGLRSYLDGTPVPEYRQKASVLLRRPEVGIRDLRTILTDFPEELFDEASEETVELEIKYEGYISMQRTEIDRLNRLKEQAIPGSFNFSNVHGLSREMKEKLSLAKPRNLAEAAQIPGITPAALTAVLHELRR